MKEENVIDLLDLGTENLEAMEPEEEELVLDEPEVEETVVEELPIPEGMKKDELIAYAKEHNIEINESATKQEIIDTIEAN